MTIPLWCLLAFAGWTLGLVGFAVGPYRILALLRHELTLSEIRADRPHGGERYQRLMRAHMNCVENLPVFASLVFLAHATAYEATMLNVLCVGIVVLRIIQSVTHIWSARSRAVMVRFTAFALQAVSFLVIGIMIAVR